MEFEHQDFTGVHVWYQGKAWILQGHNEDGSVRLFSPEEGHITVKESEIAPRS